MAEEFQAAGICGGARWNSPKSVMFSGGCLSPCSMGIAGDNGGTLGWQNVDSSASDMKSRLSCSDNISHNSTSNSMAFAQKLQREADSDSGGSTVTMDSTLQMMGLGFSTSANSSSDWNQTMLQEDLNPSLMGTSQDCQGYLTAGFPISPSVTSFYGYSSSSLLPNFYESENSPSFLNNSRSINNFMSLQPSCSNVSDIDPHLSSVSWVKPEPFLKPSSSSLLPSHLKQQTRGFNFSNTNTAFWNPSMANTNSIRSNNFAPLPQISTLCHNNITPKTSSSSEGRDSGMAGKKASDEPATKKARITTPSPLPTFKVRKENLRDQITALQQLVSPFGKTDTASVLQEAIEYIKFLHDQVSVLSTPYMKQGASVQQQHQQISGKLKNPEGNNNQDLRSRGLCLVPISSTFPVTNETTADFWTPTFGGNNFR